MAQNITDSFWRRRVTGPLLALLRQGVTPEKLALGLALGIVLGVTPMLGTTTILCAAAAFLLRLNPAAIQLVNFFMAPAQLALIIPFIRAGEWIFRAARNPVTLERILALVRANAWTAIVTLWSATMHALCAWAIVGLLAVFPLYWIVLTPVRRLARARGEAV